MSLNSKCNFAIVNKAISYYKIGKITEAIDCCELALSLDSEDYNNYATVLADANCFEESLNAYNTALNLSPNNLNLLRNKLIILDKMKDWENVLFLCDEIINRDNKIRWVGIIKFMH